MESISSNMPLLIYDGDCGFCEKSARLAQTWTHGDVAIQPWQKIPPELAELGLTAVDGMTQVWFAQPDGRLSGGAAAVNDMLRLVWWARPLAWLYPLPGIKQLQERVYRWVAENRYRLPGGSPQCQIGDEVSR